MKKKMSKTVKKLVSTELTDEQRFWRGEDKKAINKLNKLLTTQESKPAVKAPVNDALNEAEAKKFSFRKLSNENREPRFCKCQKCRMIFENDVNTMHAPCPKCGAVMENLSRKAAENLQDLWNQEAKSHA
jgi:NADH pyrophosphatase NudC (nudix superfamily)